MDVACHVNLSGQDGHHEKRTCDIHMDKALVDPHNYASWSAFAHAKVILLKSTGRKPPQLMRVQDQLLKVGFRTFQVVIQQIGNKGMAEGNGIGSQGAGPTDGGVKMHHQRLRLAGHSLCKW